MDTVFEIYFLHTVTEAGNKNLPKIYYIIREWSPITNNLLPVPETPIFIIFNCLFDLKLKVGPLIPFGLFQSIYLPDVVLPGVLNPFVELPILSKVPVLWQADVHQYLELHKVG